MAQRQLGLPKADLPFDELAELRDLTQQLLASSLESLANYRDDESGGYFHVLGDDAKGGSNNAGDFSKASTSTVVRYLAASGQWTDAADKAQSLFDAVVVAGNWTSAGLDPDNPFTGAFLLELAGDLVDFGATPNPDQRSILDTKLLLLKGALSGGNGAIAIELGLPNAYLTQLAVRVLKAWDIRILGAIDIPTSISEPLFDAKLRGETRSWAMATVDTEIALSASAPRESDVFELGYAILLVLGSSPPPPAPIERRRLAHGLALVFAGQGEDGTWPQSRRLFHYPVYGNAYCYEHEFLTQLLEGVEDPLLLRPFLPNFRRAMDRLDVEYVHLPKGGYGWMSGHHRQLHWPESWSTASCFHFAHLLDRFVADAIRDGILEHLGARPTHPNITPDDGPFDEQLDSGVTLNGKRESLKTILDNSLIQPVMKQRHVLRNGGKLKKGTPLSAILYGPPGTSKTTYVAAIAAKIGWPLISIDPSHLLRNGIDDLFTEVNRVFRMLEYAENVVVFFDEIDELVRDRFGSEEQSESRFLTTAMLPKIVKLRESRQRLFFVATNHLEVFDAAIARPGRFDLILPVMPPTADAKITHWDLTASLQSGLALTPDMKTKIEELSYDECGAVAEELKQKDDLGAFESFLNTAHAKCMLQSKVKGTQNWVDLMKAEESKIRVP